MVSKLRFARRPKVPSRWGARADEPGAGARPGAGSTRSRARRGQAPRQSAPAGPAWSNRSAGRSSRAAAGPTPGGPAGIATRAGRARDPSPRTWHSVAPFGQQLLDGADGLGRIEVLRAGFGAVHDRMAPIQPE